MDEQRCRAKLREALVARDMFQLNGVLLAGSMKGLDTETMATEELRALPEPVRAWWDEDCDCADTPGIEDTFLRASALLGETPA